MAKRCKQMVVILMSIWFGMGFVQSPTVHAKTIQKNPIAPMEHYYWGGYRKEGVRKYQEWGNIERVSDNLVTPGWIYSQKKLERGVEVTGAIDEILTISLFSRVSSEKGYGVLINTPGTYYLGYKILYEVEEGYRVKDDVFGGTSRNYYKVRRPVYGQYEPVRVH
ncbi:hypothetical protein J7S27_06375 [Carnobacteriaceae bacterium zg-C25]|nr:hypothetical protein J7S27_06375 [Carnobacteriaceae bacterium zg-C25]